MRFGLSIGAANQGKASPQGMKGGSSGSEVRLLQLLELQMTETTSQTGLSRAVPMYTGRKELGQMWIPQGSMKT